MYSFLARSIGAFLSLIMSVTFVQAAGVRVNTDYTMTGTINAATDTGAANAYVITLVPALSAYRVGAFYAFKAANANTATSTLAVNGLSALTLKTYTAGVKGNLIANDIGVGQYIVCYYDGTDCIVTSQLGTAAGAPPPDSVTYAQIQDVSATSRFLGRITAGAGDIEELTAANAKTILGLAASDLSNGTTGSGAVVLATSPTLVTPVLGTPASGNATNLTAIPAAQVTGANALPDSVLSTNVATLVGTQTFTNKRNTPRVVTVADATSITCNWDTMDVCDQVNTQATGTLTLVNFAGTCTDRQLMRLHVKSTNVQTFAPGTAFRFGTDISSLPPTTAGGKIDKYGFECDTVAGKIDLISISRGY